MTYPITPNPGIHNPPTQQVFDTGAGSGAQLAMWAKNLPLAMTLELINVILEALGLGAYTGPVDEIITTLSQALTARFGALGVLLESVLTDVLTDYNDWPVLINALEQAWLTYVTTVTQLDEQEIVTLIEIVGALLGISPAEIQRLVTDFEALEADSEAAAAAFNTLLLSWWTDITTDYANWPVLIAAMESAWQTYITTITQIDESEILTLEDITGALLGISPQTLQELNNDFANLQTDSSEKTAALTTLFQAVWTDITTESGSALLTALDTAWNTYVTTVTGIETSEISTLEDIVGAILGVSPAAIAQFYTDFTDFLSTGSWTDFTSAWNDLKALFTGNASTSATGGNISASQVTNEANSLQPVPNFPYALSLQAAAQWSWDGTVGYGGLGSAKVVANGIEQILRGVVGDVQTGQVITVTGYVQWSGLTATGSPIQLQLLPSTGTPVVIGEITSPGASASWTELTGTYTVPSGVTTVQILLVVTSAATAGSIWWGVAEDDASGGFLPTLASDFTALQTDYNAKAAAFNTLLESWWTDITTDTYANLGPTWWTTLINALESAWQTYITTITEINEAELVTLEDILGAIIGLSPATIQTLNTDFSTLQTDYNDASAAFVTFLQSIWTAIEDDLSNWTNLIAALEAAWNTYVTTVSGLESSEFATLQQIINALFGINPTTGQVPQSQVGSNLGLASIEQDLTTFWDNLFGAGNSPTSAPVAATALPTINIGGVIDTIENHIQAIVDHSIQALFGGSSTGNPTSAMHSALTAIPAGNIVGSLSGSTVSYGATGGGSSAYQSSGATQTISWSHTRGSSDNYVVVAVNFWTAKIFSNVTCSVTYGSFYGMASLGVVEYNGGACGLELFGLANPPSGAQTVTVSVSGSVGTAIALAGNSVSYSGWSSTSAATTASGSFGTSPALTVGSATGDAVVQAFGLAGGGTAALSSYDGTSRWYEGSVTETDALTMLLGDAAGSSSVSFVATGNSPSLQVWAGIAVSLKPNS